MSADPTEEAARAMSQQFSQAVMVGVQMLELGLRMRAESEAREAAAAREAAGAARAARQEAYSLDRVRFSRAFDAQWLRGAGGQELVEAWGAAARWADTSVQADTATRRLEFRLRQVWPQQMAYYDSLRAQGWDRLAAMNAAADKARQDAASSPRSDDAEKATASQEATELVVETAVVLLEEEDPRLREARAAFSPAQDAEWVAQAGPQDLDRAWRAAAVWADLDGGAERAAMQIEERLRQMRPDIMADFDTLRAAGASRMEALWEATHSTTSTPETDAWRDVPPTGGSYTEAADVGHVTLVHEPVVHQRAAAASYPTSVATVVATSSARTTPAAEPAVLPAGQVRPALPASPSVPPPAAPQR